MLYIQEISPFSTNGIETAYLLLFLAWAEYLLSPPNLNRGLPAGFVLGRG